MSFEFEGSAALVAYGLETSEGMGGKLRKFMRIESESLTMNRTTERNPNMDPSNLQTEPQNLASHGGGKIKSAPDVETILTLRAHQRGRATMSTLAAGVEQWDIRNRFRSDAPNPLYIDSLFAEVYRDDGIGHLYLGAKCDTMDLTVVENKFVALEHGFIFSRESEMADPVPLGANNAAFTGYVLVRGQRNDPESVIPIRVQVLTPGALDGTAKVAFKLGAGAFGATSFQVWAGVPIEVKFEDGTVAGDRSNHEKVQVIFVPGAPGDVLTLGDEWSIAQPRPEPSPIYSTAQVLTAVGAEAAVTISGVTKTYAIHTFAVKYTRPRKLNPGISTKYGFSVKGNGVEVAEFTFARDYTDLDFYRAMVANRPVQLNCPIYGNLIDATHQETWQLGTTHAKVDKAGSVTSVPTSLPEAITIASFTDGMDPSLTETIVCTSSTL